MDKELIAYNEGYISFLNTHCPYATTDSESMVLAFKWNEGRSVAERDARALIRIFQSSRFNVSSEFAMQGQVEEVLHSQGIEVRPEFRLAGTEVVDFYLPGLQLAIECKIAGQPISIHRQLERYAKYECVSRILLLTAIYMGVKHEICGKSAYVVQTGKAWL